MSERASRPNVDAAGRLAIGHYALCLSGRDVGTGERADDIVLTAEPNGPADTTQHAIDLLKIPVPVEVQNRQLWRLDAQFFVCHEFPLPHKASGNLSTTVVYPTYKIHALDEVRTLAGVSFWEQTAVLSW